MPIVIQPYRKEHEASVAQFNRRLQAGGAESDLVFSEYSEPWLPPVEGRPLYNELFVALDGGTVRGGYALKRQNFTLPNGSVRSVGFYHHPLSEGIVDKSYAVVGALLLRDAMQRERLLYCLGMGGYDRPLPKMLMGLGWSNCLVPFYFRVVHPYRFLREMRALRTSRWRSLAMDLGAFTGAGWAAMRLQRSITTLRAPRVSPVTVTEVEEFSDWVDPLWERTKHAYTLTAVRDSATLRLLYAASDQHFTRLRVSRDGTDLGWAVVGERQKNAKFGSMRVGSILDCWASPGDTLPVVLAAAQALERRRVDLIVSNQSHHSWCRALEAAGFLKAQSNFIFAASPKLAELLQPFAESSPRMHFTRGDGDGLPRNF